MKGVADVKWFALTKLHLSKKGAVFRIHVNNKNILKFVYYGPI